METNNKIRAALEQAKDIARTIYSTSETGSPHEDLAEKIVEIAHAALAEPPKNCEKYTSLDEARNAYMAINELPEGNRDEDMRQWLCDFHDWLFAPAQEGGAK